jgi:hypothetical protein
MAAPSTDWLDVMANRHVRRANMSTRSTQSVAKTVGPTTPISTSVSM